MSKTIDSDCRGRTVCEDVHSYSVLYNVFIGVVVAVPEEPQVVSVFFLDEEVVEHLLYVAHKYYGISAEAEKYLQKFVVEVWTRQ